MNIQLCKRNSYLRRCRGTLRTAGSRLKSSVARSVAGAFGMSIHLLFVKQDDRLSTTASGVSASAANSHYNAGRVTDSADWPSSVTDSADWPSGGRCSRRLNVFINHRQIMAGQQTMHHPRVINSHVMVVDRPRLYNCEWTSTTMELG